MEWPIDNEGPLTVFDMSGPPPGGRGNSVEAASFTAPDATDALPEGLRGFVRPSEVLLAGMAAPVSVGAHHGGSHPFLVHEFISSIAEGREPLVGALRAAAWTAPGVCAHESALRGGERIEVPDYLSRAG